MTVSVTVIRNIAYVGALVAGLLLGGAGAGIAAAEPDDHSGSADDGPSTTSDVETPSGGGGPEGASDGGGESSGSDRPTSTAGNGRTDVVDPNATPRGANRPTSVVKPPRKYPPMMRIPVLTLPSTEELWAPGPTKPSAFFRTIEIPIIPTLADVFEALAQPEPAPPGPAFRTQQEEAPVIDATGNTTGGSDRAAADEAPPVIRVPVVVAPRVPAPAVPRSAPPSSAAAPAVAAAGSAPAMAGVRTPPIRGSLPPSGTIPLTRSGAPATGQVAPAGYARFLRGATIGELAAVALPGVGGLLFLTFSGGVIGYRQANSSRYVRTAAVARFLP